jgi:hypothetical protein
LFLPVVYEPIYTCVVYAYVLNCTAGPASKQKKYLLDSKPSATLRLSVYDDSWSQLMCHSWSGCLCYCNIKPCRRRTLRLHKHVSATGELKTGWRRRVQIKAEGRLSALTYVMHVLRTIGLPHVFHVLQDTRGILCRAGLHDT